MPINIDFSGVQTLEPIPVGIYSIIVSAVEEQPGTEFPYLAWEFTVAEGDYEGRKLWVNTSLSPKALWKLKESLIALGIDPITLEGEVSLDPQDLVGEHAFAIVNVEPRTDTGELRNVVTKLLPLTEKAADSVNIKAKVVGVTVAPVKAKLKFK